jgi:hypothetical protein
MHIHMYVYICICVYAYICICIFMYVYMCICMYAYIYVCIYMYINICMYMYVCTLPLMYISKPQCAISGCCYLLLTNYSVLNVADTKYLSRHLKDWFVFAPVIGNSWSGEGCSLHPATVRLLKESGMDRAQVWLVTSLRWRGVMCLSGRTCLRNFVLFLVKSCLGNLL